jgi:hypothetical protein
MRRAIEIATGIAAMLLFGATAALAAPMQAVFTGTLANNYSDTLGLFGAPHALLAAGSSFAATVSYDPASGTQFISPTYISTGGGFSPGAPDPITKIAITIGLSTYQYVPSSGGVGISAGALENTFGVIDYFPGGVPGSNFQLNATAAGVPFSLTQDFTAAITGSDGLFAASYVDFTGGEQFTANLSNIAVTTLAQVATVPEPLTLSFFAAGLMGVMRAREKQARRKARAA